LDQEAFQQFLRELEKGTVEVNIDRVFEFAEVVEAHQYMELNQAKGKLVVRIE
jgi:NADPH2:quinone reductase